MAIVWFIAFVIMCFIARSLSGEVKQAKESMEVAKKIERHAQETLDRGNALVSEGYALKRLADLQTEKTNAESLVYHAAIEEVVNLWVNDSWKSITDKLTAGNYSTQKARMEKVFETCRKHGVEFDGRQERAFFVRLESEWKKEIEAEKAREEQARIKELMREEQRAEKMRASEIKKIESEKQELEQKHSEHLERIKMLKELEVLKQLTQEQQRELEEVQAENLNLEKEIEEKERRKSMAELTRAGNVYVISNFGSFGNNTFKVGMTRRLIPEDRVKELGDASVPFPFDIHMMVATEDAPKLESLLHQALWDHRMNLVNDGKEFFKIDLETIKNAVDKHAKGVVYEFKMQAEASQWRESEARRQQNQIGQYKRSVEKNDEDSNEVA